MLGVGVFIFSVGEWPRKLRVGSVRRRIDLGPFL